MTELDELLDQAASVFRNGEQDYRDACVTAGRLLHAYVVARVRLGDGMPEDRRTELGHTREAATEDAAGKLRTKRSRITSLIRVAAVVDVLSEGGEVGGLSYASLRALTPLVENRAGDVARGRVPTDGECLPSEGLAWRPKQIRGETTAAETFRRAVREDWGSKAIERHLASLSFPRHGGQQPRLEIIGNGSNKGKVIGYKNPNEANNVVDPIEGVAVGLASPRDVAERLTRLIEQSAEPLTVLTLLEGQLTDLRRRLRHLALLTG